MPLCQTCIQTNDVRQVKPAGTCEQCRAVTPFQDRLCSSCSDAAGRCQSCRSHRVQSLISVPHATQPVLAALAAQQEQQEQQQQMRQQARRTWQQEQGTGQYGGAELMRHASPPASARAASAAASSGAAAAAATPSSSPSRSSAMGRSLHSTQAATGRSSYLATSPFHFQHQITYSLDAPSPQLQSPDHPRLMAGDFADGSLSSTLVPPPPPPPASDELLGRVILSPSGRLVPATLTPLSPRMAVRQNATGHAPAVRGPDDAAAVVAAWPRSELVNTLFHYYCNWRSTRLHTLMSLSRFRNFCSDAGLGSGTGAQGHAGGRTAPAAAAVPASVHIPSNRIDILFTQCTRPLSGSREKMGEEQFFEALGALALYVYGPNAAPLGTKLTAVQRDPSVLVPALEQLFERHLVPLAAGVVAARAGGAALRGEEMDPGVMSLLLRYEDGLRRIFVRHVRATYADLPRADEQLSHPLLEEGWRAFTKHYQFFPDHVSASTVLRLFVGAATGTARSGNAERAACSFDDFMHALFQLAQVAFALTPNAAPRERVELLLHKIDQPNRELAFMPATAHKPNRSGSTTSRDTPSLGDGGQLVVRGSPRSSDEALVAAVSLPREAADQAFSGVQSLFSDSHMACARDLYNLYCNTASQTSYSEIMPRQQWVRLLRDAGLLGGRVLAAADGDLIFNKVLAGAAPSAASGSGSSTGTGAFSRGRTMTFNIFLLGLAEAASKSMPDRPATSAIHVMFEQHLVPLLAERIALLQKSQRDIELPLGVGLNSSGLAAAAEAGAHSPAGSWDASWGDDGGVGGGGGANARSHEGLTGGPASASIPGATPLYPNHPSSTSSHLGDACALMSSDPGVRSLFSSYSKALKHEFFNASWCGVEAQNGVSIPRLGSSLLLHSSGPATVGAQQRSWDVFLQSKQLLSEHAFRRWLGAHGVLPELLAHKQVTMLLREGNVGFDRSQNEFVLNWAEFQETLLRIALLSFASEAYAAYTTAASKLELLFFLIDQRAKGALNFRAFKHLPSAAAAHRDRNRDGGVMGTPLDAATAAMSQMHWQRTQSSELGVKALLEQAEPQSRPSHHPHHSYSHSARPSDSFDGDSSDNDSSGLPAASMSLPQDWGHGARSFTTVVTSPAPGAMPLQRFNTSTATPRAPFATTILEPFDPALHAQTQPPNHSPTRLLFQQTPFRQDAQR